MDMLRYIPAVLEGGSTIPPDEVDLSGATVASVVITGLAVVFIGLILLIIFVTIYGAVFKRINAAAAEKARKKEQAAIEAAKPKDNPVVPKTPEPEIEDGIEEETVAVIMAAIAAMSAASGKKLSLRSVKSAKPRRSAWASAGIAENTRPF